MWTCLCECGTIRDLRETVLVSGKSRSCGCLHGSITHGMTDSLEHTVWCAMRKRCRVGVGRKDYAGAGIRVCKGWDDSFTQFFLDMGPRLNSKRSIDRINGNGHYSCGKCHECLENNWPSNCRWATAREQANNVRRNILFEYGGVTMTLSQWARFCELRPSTVHTRYRKGKRGFDLINPRKRGE